jgi:hypothetical protein
VIFRPAKDLYDRDIVIAPAHLKVSPSSLKDDLTVDSLFSFHEFRTRGRTEDFDNGDHEARDENEQDDILCGRRAIFVVVKCNQKTFESFHFATSSRGNIGSASIARPVLGCLPLCAAFADGFSKYTM